MWHPLLAVNCQILYWSPADSSPYPPLQALYLMPSSSARCAQFPRAQDKVHFYIKLRELRDQLKGEASTRTGEIQEVAYTFNLKLAKGESPLHLQRDLWWLLGRWTSW